MAELPLFPKDLIDAFTATVRERTGQVIDKYVPPSSGEVGKTAATSLTSAFEQFLPPTPKEVAKGPAGLLELVPKPKDVIDTLLDSVGASPKGRLDMVADVAAIATPPIVIAVGLLLFFGKQ